MRSAIITITILFLGLTFGVQDKGITNAGQGFSLTKEQITTDLSIPKNMNFQGTLYQDGNTVNDTMDMWFGIYDALSGGTLLYSTTNTNVAVLSGWFSTILTNIPNSVFPVTGPIRYLEIKAPATGPALTPRLQLASVGYAYHAITSDTAEYSKAGLTTRPITPPIYSTEIRDTTIIAGKIKDGAMTSAKLADNAVTSTKIQDGQVQTADIADGAVNSAKITDNSVASGDILDGTIAAADIGTGAVTNAKIADNAVTTGKIQNGTILLEDLSFTPAVRPLTPLLSGTEVAKPCTLAGSIAWPGAILRVSNSGDGRGIMIDSTYIGSNAMHINRAGWNGLYVYRANGYGVFVDSAVEGGVKVDSVKKCGFSVNKADTGLKIQDATYGINVGNSTQQGILIETANRDAGIEVRKAGSLGFFECDGLRIGNAKNDGVEVDTAGDVGFKAVICDTGLKVWRAKYDGVYIDSAGSDGVQVRLAKYNGVHVDRALDNGLYVDSAGDNGVYVNKANQNGIYIDTADYGVRIRKAYGGIKIDTLYGHAFEVGTSTAGSGLYIDRVNQDGVCVRRASNVGFQLDSAGYGLYISYAKRYGVTSNSTSFGVSAMSESCGVLSIAPLAGYFIGDFVAIGGGKSAGVKIDENDWRLLYCQESPEVWFEDAGEGQLKNGKAHIELEPIYLKTVTISNQYPIKVFVQLTSGNPMNVVIKKGLTGFDVIAENPTSNATFDFRIMAKRKGFENLRLKKMERGTTPEDILTRRTKECAEMEKEQQKVKK